MAVEWKWRWSGSRYHTKAAFTDQLYLCTNQKTFALLLKKEILKIIATLFIDSGPLQLLRINSSGGGGGNNMHWPYRFQLHCDLWARDASSAEAATK